MATGRAEKGKRVVALSVALLLPGCVDPLVNRPKGEVERWTGRAEAVDGGEAACGPVAFELFRDGLSIGGRAREPEAVGEGVFAAAGSWWVEGTVNPNGSFLVSLRRQGPVGAEGPRPASVWRGRFGASEAVAIEQPPSCGRRVRLVREPAGTPAS